MPRESNGPDTAFFIVVHQSDPGHAVAAELDRNAAHFLVKLVLIGSAEHGLVAGAHGPEDLTEPLVLFLRRPTLGDVVQVNGDERFLASAGGEDMRVRGQCLPIAAQGFDFKALPYRRDATANFADGFGDGTPQSLGQPAVVDSPFQKRGGGTAKQDLRSRVEHYDLALQVHADIGIGRAADDVPEPGLAVPYSFHVPALPMHPKTRSFRPRPFFREAA